MQPIGDFQIPAGHPALPGHFPGRPVVPGVVLLDEVLSLVRLALGGEPACLTQVKFLRPVVPGEAVDVAVEPAGQGRVAFLARVGGRPVLRGSITLHAA